MKFQSNKRGSVADILIWLVLSFIIVVFFALWIYGFHQITITLEEMDKPIFKTNLSDIASDTFGQIDPVQTRSLHTLAFIMIVMMGITIMLSNFIVKSHPAFFLVYLMVVIAAVMASAILSNQYEDLLDDRVIGTTLQEFKAASFIMVNLPIWTTIFGLFGALFLFMGIIRDAGVGGPVA